VGKIPYKRDVLVDHKPGMGLIAWDASPIGAAQSSLEDEITRHQAGSPYYFVSPIYAGYGRHELFIPGDSFSGLAPQNRMKPDALDEISLIPSRA